MKTWSQRIATVSFLGALLGAVGGTLVACDDGPLGCLYTGLGFACDYTSGRDFWWYGSPPPLIGAAGVAAHNELRTATLAARQDFRIALDNLARTLELPAGSSGDEVALALQAHLEAHVIDKATLDAEKVVCTSRGNVAVALARQCDAALGLDVPGNETLPVSCLGRCAQSVQDSASCGPTGTAVCVVDGSSNCANGLCEGTCIEELAVGAACAGTCRGQCDAACGLVDQDGNCQGRCLGNCVGTCEDISLAGKPCSGSCLGRCSSTVPAGEDCEATAQMTCTSSDGGVACAGTCEGLSRVDTQSAACAVAVTTQLRARLECAAPRVSIRYDFLPSVDATARAAFAAWARDADAELATLLQLRTRLEAQVAAISLMNQDETIEEELESYQGSNTTQVASGAYCGLINMSAVQSALDELAVECVEDINQLNAILAILESSRP